MNFLKILDLKDYYVFHSVLMRKGSLAAFIFEELKTFLQKYSVSGLLWIENLLLRIISSV